MPLIFQSTAVARPDYFDRNPTTQIVNYDVGGFGPHALIVFNQYTVPVRRKAYLDSIYLFQSRSAVAGAPGVVTSKAQISIAAAAAQEIFRVQYTTNTVGVSVDNIFPIVGFLNTGDNIQLANADTSTGGSVDYVGSVKVTSFDA